MSGEVPVELPIDNVAIWLGRHRLVVVIILHEPHKLESLGWMVGEWQLHETCLSCNSSRGEHRLRLKMERQKRYEVTLKFLIDNVTSKARYGNRRMGDSHDANSKELSDVCESRCREDGTVC